MTIPNRMREAARISALYADIKLDRDHGFDDDGRCDAAVQLAADLRKDADDLEKGRPVAWRWLREGKPERDTWFDDSGPNEDVVALGFSNGRTVQYLYASTIAPDTIEQREKTMERVIAAMNVEGPDDTYAVSNAQVRQWRNQLGQVREDKAQAEGSGESRLPATHVPVRRMTEQEAGEAWAADHKMQSDDPVCESLDAWRAALRWAGVIKEGE